ncbi:MAG: DUF2442 domain-containing protein [Lachnospiraceae bacterium]|nr:DUF2442 domain-containing protein [Lachnospiraceae bacterium]
MIPSAVQVKPLENYRLFVTFDSGEKKIYDVNPLIRGEWFGQLKDLNVFNTVHIAGLSVEWEDGQDVCPDDLYYNSVPVGTDGSSASEQKYSDVTKEVSRCQAMQEIREESEIIGGIRYDRKKGTSYEDTKQYIMEEYQKSEEEAEKLLKEYWQ